MERMNVRDLARVCMKNHTGADPGGAEKIATEAVPKNASGTSRRGEYKATPTAIDPNTPPLVCGQGAYVAWFERQYCGSDNN